MTIEPKPSPEDNYGFPPEYTVMFIARSNTYVVARGERSVRVPGAMLRVPGGREAAITALSDTYVDLSAPANPPPRRLKPGDHGYYKPGGLEPTGNKFVGDDRAYLEAERRRKEARISVSPTSTSVSGHEIARQVERTMESLSAREDPTQEVLPKTGTSNPPRREVPGMADISVLVTKDGDPIRKGKYIGPRGDSLNRDQWQELFVPITVLEEDFAHGYMVRTSWVPAYPSPAEANWESVCVSQLEVDPLMTSDLMWRYFTYEEALKGHALLLREVIQHAGMEFDNYVQDEEL